MLGSHIITHYTGSYVSFVKERILNPLNMTSTTFSPSEAVKSGEMTQSWTNQGRRIPQWFTEDMKSLNAGPGGLISNVEDMVSCVCTANMYIMTITDGYKGEMGQSALERRGRSIY